MVCYSIIMQINLHALLSKATENFAPNIILSMLSNFNSYLVAEESTENLPRKFCVWHKC